MKRGNTTIIASSSILKASIPFPSGGPLSTTLYFFSKLLRLRSAQSLAESRRSKRVASLRYRLALRRLLFL